MLKVHTDSDLRVLADRLGEVLSVAPEAMAQSAWDPMQPEWVAVPSAGMRTWLSLELARRLGAGVVRGGGAAAQPVDGVTANVEFAFPGSLRTRILAACLPGRDLRENHDPWTVERLVWPILEVGCAGSLRSLPDALMDPPAGSSAYSAARHVADLFDRYHVHRPAMVGQWHAGDDLDGIGQPLPAHHCWQPALWREVRAVLGTPSPPERMVHLLARLRAGDLEVDLPARVCVFGMSLLPGGPGFLDLARGLAEHRDVHLFVVTPSAQLAPRFRSGPGEAPGGVATTANPTGHLLRADVDATTALRHPLLRSWARLHYETAAALVGAGLRPDGPDELAPTDTPVTLLGQLQADLGADREPGASLVPAEADDSIEFHACHGPTRQVEVLRDTILRLLADHSGLQEDDVLVVCPDLDTFAPLIEATFGPSAHTGAAGPSPDRVPVLRYRIADRSVGSSAPLIGALTTLLGLLAGRFDAPAVLDFLNLEPVRLRHRFGDEELATIADWVLGTNIRWGLDPQHREAHGVPAGITTNTWQAGIERVLLGAAARGTVTAGTMFEPSLGDVIPYSTEGSDVAVAGRLAELMWRMGELAANVTAPRPVAEWIVLLQQVTGELFSVRRDDAWQLDRLLGTLGAITDSATPIGPIGGHPVGLPPEPCLTPLSFTDLRRLLAERLDGIEGRPAFFRGGITISSLTPLRWVPHRVICMLGMDTAALTVRPTDGDDLAAGAALIGDRDRRAELRQSLLETVLSAQDHLVVVRTGSDVRTNQPVPMPVALAELLDAVAEGVHPEHREGVRGSLETVHPRQPYDERYLGVAEPATGVVLAPTFDHGAVEAARARRGRSTRGRPFLAAPLGPPRGGTDEPEMVSLDELHRFFRNPIRHFVEHRLELYLPRESGAPVGTLAAKLEPLESWAVGSALLALLGELDDPDEAVRRWRWYQASIGAVPPGALGEVQLDRIADEVLRMWNAALSLGVDGTRSDPLAVDVVLRDGTRVLGSVDATLGPSSTGDQRGGPGRVTYARRKSDHLIAIWIDLAALTLSHPGEEWRGVAVTRSEHADTFQKKGKKYPKIHKSAHELRSDDRAGAAAQALEVAVDLYRRGRCEPLPLFRKFSEALYRNPATTLRWSDRFEDDAETLVYGELSGRELVAIELLSDDPPGAQPDRTRRYAEHLYGAIDRTMSPLEVGEVDR